jgi:hypothetical protein
VLVPALPVYSAAVQHPIDTEGSRVSGAFLFVGTTSMFERAGFVRLVETSAHSAGRIRWLVRLDLAAHRG